MTRVAVFCGSHNGGLPEYRAAAVDLGREVARRGFAVVYGGSESGLMGAMANAAMDAGASLIGVVPAAPLVRERVHPGLSEVRVAASLPDRKAQMIGLADAFVALPGGLGTLDELMEVCTLSQLDLHDKPCGILNVSGYFDLLLSFLGDAVERGFISRRHLESVLVDDDPRRLLDALCPDAGRSE